MMNVFGDKVIAGYGFVMCALRWAHGKANDSSSYSHAKGSRVESTSKRRWL